MLVLPHDAAKSSTGDVYRALRRRPTDSTNGARRSSALADVRRAATSPRCRRTTSRRSPAGRRASRSGRLPRRRQRRRSGRLRAVPHARTKRRRSRRIAASWPGLDHGTSVVRLNAMTHAAPSSSTRARSAAAGFAEHRVRTRSWIAVLEVVLAAVTASVSKYTIIVLGLITIPIYSSGERISAARSGRFVDRGRVAGARDRRRPARRTSSACSCWCSRALRRGRAVPDLRRPRLARHYTSGLSLGRSQVVRQRVLVPRSQVRILAPQPPCRMTDNVAALVMAAGLGTRMRSATPKHLHPLLGRRMVDWVIAAAREAGARADRRRRVAGRPATASTASRSRCRSEPLGTGDAVRAARAKLDSASGDVLVLSGDTPLLTADALRELLDDAPARARRGDGPLVRAARPARSTDASSATGTAGSRASSRPPTRRPTSSSSARSTRRSTSSPRRSSGRRSSGCSRRTRRASSTSPTQSASSCRTASPSPCTSPTIRARSRESTRAPSSRSPPPTLRDRINEAHMLAGVTIVDPQSTWIDGGVEIENDVTIHPFTVIRGRVKIASGRRGRAVRVRPSGHRASAATRRSATFVEVKKSSVGARRRSRTSRTSATPRSARIRTSPPATSPPTSSTSRGSRKP